MGGNQNGHVLNSFPNAHHHSAATPLGTSGNEKISVEGDHIGANGAGQCVQRAYFGGIANRWLATSHEGGN